MQTRKHLDTKILLVYKPAGCTPLQIIEQLKHKNPLYAEEKLSYAGRLDPMAEGLLLILVGEENKKREEYLHLPKTYEFEILVGVSTDTYDVMGKITETQDVHVDAEAFKTQLTSLLGTHTFPYPPYSSKTINGKPLHWYARNHLLSTITVPQNPVTITRIKYLSSRTLTNQEVHTSITERIRKVRGDFRQQEILEKWQEFFSAKKSQHMTVIGCITEATSGTYIRGIVHELGNRTDIPMLAFTIKRIKIGEYKITKAEQNILHK